MNSTKTLAKKAGLLYLIMTLTSPLGILYIPSIVIVPIDSTATVSNIINHELLYRLSIISNLICQTSFIFLVLALYRLFKNVNELHAKLMVSLVIVSVPVALFNSLIQMTPLFLLSGSDYLKSFEPAQLNSLVMIFLNLFQQGIVIVGIFWGLWLFPFGYLVIKSGFIPKIFGILLIMGCFAYLIDSIFALLLPQYRDSVKIIVMLPMIASEISILLWLLIKGAREQ